MRVILKALSKLHESLGVGECNLREFSNSTSSVNPWLHSYSCDYLYKHIPHLRRISQQVSSISTALLKSNISRLIPETYKEKNSLNWFGWSVRREIFPAVLKFKLINHICKRIFQQHNNTKPPHQQDNHNKPQLIAFNRTWPQKKCLQAVKISKYHIDILTTAGLDLWLFTASPTALIRISLSCFVACSLSLVNKHNRCLTSLLICGVPSCKLNSTNSCIRPWRNNEQKHEFKYA